MTALDSLLYAHAFSTLSLVGLIWTIQLVHYPLFLRVPREQFGAYEGEHMRRITWLVGPLMLAEAVTAVLLLVKLPADSGAPVGLALLFVIWLSTATIQGPLHAQLAKGGFDEAKIRRLVRSNWIRTVCWTTRGVLALGMLGTIDATLVTT